MSQILLYETGSVVPNVLMTDSWDEVEAYMSESELHNLIIELRSLTLGVGWHTYEYDHLSELTGRGADEVKAKYGAEAEA